MAKQKRWCDRTPEYKARKARKKNLKRYGLTVEDYDNLNKTQHGKCALCDKPPKEGRRLSVHYDKKLQKVLSLLCERCRRYLQFLGKDTDRIETALGYILVTKE